MSNRETVEACLRELGGVRGIDLSLDADGLVAMSFESGHRLTLEVPETGDRLFGHIGVKHLDLHDGAIEMRRALELNLFGLATPAAWVAVDPETTLVTLCAVRETTGLDGEALGDWIAALLDDVATVAAVVGGWEPAAANDAEAAEPAFADDMFIIRG
ncbi:CesT family type III secretion system chaperone [Methyloraptor flagellatus]|jgi:hypothetical protein|uniref:CesT family type III secretion system chaperone n=1 Tax=Methyloraptor flagellatus TaxID=3162530 RepID=A0AAU7X7C7_9HYPH